MTPNTVLSFIASLIHLRRPRRRSSRPGFHTTWRFAWPMVVNRQLPRLSAEAPSELHLNSAHLTSLVRRAALVSVSDASGPGSDPGATDNCPVCAQSCQTQSVRVAIFRALTPGVRERGGPLVCRTARYWS